MQQVDVLIIGAGAAGLMCAIEAGKRKRSVLVIDHANKPGKKILMSGGGRCNFTNYAVAPDKFISHNRHFCKSALARYTQWDFIAWVEANEIPYHEKTLGQLFCDNKSKDIVNLLLHDCERYGAKLQMLTEVHSVECLSAAHFRVQTSRGLLQAESLVIATGGLSIPTMGASPFGYRLAQQFGLKVWPTRAGLVPFTLHEGDKAIYAPLSGVSVASEISNDRQVFQENLLFTHRGISGPAALQMSSYWMPGESLSVNLLPQLNLPVVLQQLRHEQPTKHLSSVLREWLPQRVIEAFIPAEWLSRSLASLSDREIGELTRALQTWQLRPNGTEGYRTAEVTLGGVDCDALSSKTMQALSVPGLYFIGEVVDVTGWLGGYNFQWAWSSGWAAGQHA